MSTELATTTTVGAIAELRAQIAPKATDGELAYFAQVCARLNLSPFADQIVLIGRWDKRLQREVHRHQITVAGRRTLAARTGQLAGIEGPEWCGPRIDGELRWQEVWDDDTGPPYCARVFVHVHGWVKPANGTAKWSEFAQYGKAGDLSPMWRQMPSHMLGKVAESIALRRAFPDAITPDMLRSDDALEPAAIDLVEIAEATSVHVDEMNGEIVEDDDRCPHDGCLLDAGHPEDHVAPEPDDSPAKPYGENIRALISYMNELPDDMRGDVKREFLRRFGLPEELTLNVYHDAHEFVRLQHEFVRLQHEPIDKTGDADDHPPADVTSTAAEPPASAPPAEAGGSPKPQDGAGIGPTPIDKPMSSGEGSHHEHPGEVEDIYDPDDPERPFE